jgi:hypothetical protein
MAVRTTSKTSSGGFSPGKVLDGYSVSFDRTRWTGGGSNSNTSALSYSTYAQFTANAVVGSTIPLLGASGTVRTVNVVSSPNSTKSISFPVTWPGSSFSFNNQNINYGFTMGSSDYTIMQDVAYIFSGQTFGVYPISGASESCCDPYSMSFSGISLFSLRGSNTNTYRTVTLTSITSNSGNVNYTTDGSVNSGSGLFGATGAFYLS